MSNNELAWCVAILAAVVIGIISELYGRSNDVE